MTPKTKNKTDAGKVLIQELNHEHDGKLEGHKRSFFSVIAIPALAILTGLIIGAIMIAATSETVYAAFRESFAAGPGRSLESG